MTRKRHATALARIERVRDEIYAVMHPRRDVPFYQCLTAAPPGLRDKWQRACKARDDIEMAAIYAGKAYRSNTGSFYWSN